MSRAKGGFKTRQRRNRVLKEAKGYWGKRSKAYRTAQEAVDRAKKYAYRDRKARKRDFRSLWIVRINAAARLAGLSYSAMMSGLKKAGVAIDRKSLAELAIQDQAAFNKLAETARGHLAA